MAEIKIEKKRPIWPWVLGLIAVLAIILFLLYAANKDEDFIEENNTNVYMNTDTITDSNTSTYNAGETNDTVKRYDSSTSYLVRLQENIPDSGQDSTKVTQAMYNLAYATVSKAEEINVNDTPELNSLESRLDSFPKMNNTEIADVKTISAEITAVIEDIQIKNEPSLSLNVSELKETSNTLNATTNWSKQQNNIQAYFKQAHDILINIH